MLLLLLLLLWQVATRKVCWNLIGGTSLEPLFVDFFNKNQLFNLYIRIKLITYHLSLITYHLSLITYQRIINGSKIVF